VCDAVDEIRAVGDIGRKRRRMSDGDDDDENDVYDENDDDASRFVRILTVVDSTWAPPFITLPLGLGADIVLHSGTKYLAGHSDALIGIVSCSPLTARGVRASTRLRSVQTSVGAVASPLESWLTLRGLRTLHLRLERQCKTAMMIANYLHGHPLVKACHYPGLSSHPQHDVACRQMGGGSLFGGMLSFEVESEAMAVAMAGGVRVIRRATSLGGTETLIEHRASIEPLGRRTSPVGLLRLSVGLEDAEDLIRDLEVALEVAYRVVKTGDGRANDG
jgi:cystathionine gamma-synthase